jgi:phage terminase large subunit-like protein
LFGDKRDPISRTPLADPDDYARIFVNPGDNADNLSPEYLKSLENLPERQRRRFYEGAYIDDLDGALFSYEVIARARVAEFALVRCRRVVVAVDPSGAAGRDDERADEIGIVVAAKGDDGHAYVLADRSLRDGPAAWGRAAVHAYHEFKADRIIAEENFGGEMVRFVIRAADANAPVQVISASRGKALRAEPVSALYEQGLVHHVGRLGVLEDQLCAFTTQGYRGEASPDHADALVFAITELMLKDQASILEFYRLLAQKREQEQEDEEGREQGRQRASQTGVPKQTSEPLVKLQVSAGTSIVHGLSGSYYVVGPDGIVTVLQGDATALVAAGFVRMTDGQS